MESFIVPVLVTFAGGYFLIRNVSHLRDDQKLGRSEKPFLGLLIFARPVFGGAARRCSVVV